MKVNSVVNLNNNVKYSIQNKMPSFKQREKAGFFEKVKDVFTKQPSTPEEIKSQEIKQFIKNTKKTEKKIKRESKEISSIFKYAIAKGQKNNFNPCEYGFDERITYGFIGDNKKEMPSMINLWCHGKPVICFDISSYFPDVSYCAINVENRDVTKKYYMQKKMVKLLQEL